MYKKTPGFRDLCNSANQRLQHLLINRRKVIARFPIDPMALYYSLLTDEELLAIQVLLKTNVQFRTSTDMRVIVETPGYHFRIIVTLPAAKPQFIGTATGKYREQLIRWIEVWKRAQEDTNNTAIVINEMFDCCNSAPHFVRLWPTLGAVLFPQVKRPTPMHPRIQLQMARINAGETLRRRMAEAEEVISSCFLLPKDLSPELAIID